MFWLYYSYKGGDQVMTATHKDISYHHAKEWFLKHYPLEAYDHRVILSTKDVIDMVDTLAQYSFNH